MNHRRLIVFGRYPVPGFTKTRLIPALGPVGAADLQRKLTETTLTVTKATNLAPVEFCYTGGTAQQVRRWLDHPSIRLTRQSDGDLGQRMGNAIAAALNSGCQQVILLGTDMPDITTAHISAAFNSLMDHDMVLGPCLDGGYWLIGLKRQTDVFANIEWGTEKVLDQTLEAGRRLGFRIKQLPLLRDIDNQADLTARWPHQKWRNPYLSVVIPALNEAANIEAAIDSAHSKDSEIIVVDGGSKDRTAARAQSAGALVFPAPQGRALQQNWGARKAKGKVLLFLHADSKLPHDYCTQVFETLMESRIVAGAFQFKTDYSSWSMRLIEKTVRIRSRWFQMPYGDQGLFLRKKLFDRIGGSEPVPIAEDLFLVRRLARIGRIGLAPSAVVTSGRRWRSIGVWRATLINYLIAGGCLLRIPTNYLAPFYARWTKSRACVSPARKRGSI
jgi:rSAM/selenodomain-associated transferase 2/rSAM/selenodomain-associated transferase 1